MLISAVFPVEITLLHTSNTVNMTGMQIERIVGASVRENEMLFSAAAIFLLLRLMGQVYFSLKYTKISLTRQAYTVLFLPFFIYPRNVKWACCLFSSNPGFTFTPGSLTVWPCTRAAGLWNWNLGWDSIKSRCCVLSRSDLEKVVHSKFHWHGEAGRAGSGSTETKKMEVDVSQKLAEKNKVKVFWIMSNGYRLLSFHEYCIL